MERDLALFHRRSNEEGSRLEKRGGSISLFLGASGFSRPPVSRAFDPRPSWTWVLSIFQLVIPTGNEAEFPADRAEERCCNRFSHSRMRSPISKSLAIDWASPPLFFFFFPSTKETKDGSTGTCAEFSVLACFRSVAKLEIIA